MPAPEFYLVAGDNAFALEGNDLFGAPVKFNGIPDWDAAFDFDPNEEYVEYVAHMCYYLKQAAQLHCEHNQEVFSK